MSDHLFTPEALQQILAKVPEPNPEKPHAIIGSVDSNGVQVAVVMKFSEKWEVQGVIQHDWTGDTKAGAKFIGSW